MIRARREDEGFDRKLADGPKSLSSAFQQDAALTHGEKGRDGLFLQ